MPPVSGRIMWIRFYDNNIKKPMRVFMDHHEVITHMVCYFCLIGRRTFSKIKIKYLDAHAIRSKNLTPKNAHSGEYK